MIEFNRYATKLQRVCIDEISTVQRTIETTFIDLDINPYITQSEVADEIDRIRKTYENFLGFVSELLLSEIMGILTEDEQDIDDVIWSLITTYLLLDEVCFSICTPVLNMSDIAIKNIAELSESCCSSIDSIGFVVPAPDEDTDEENEEYEEDEE